LAEADARKAAKATLRKVAERKRSTAMRKKR
jgi:hypothetical protein